MYALLGFAPGEVVPTTDLVLSHRHPDDRPEVEHLLLDAIDTGRPYSVWHRLLGADGVTRQVVTVAVGDFTADGTLVGVSGFVADVSEAVLLLRRYSQQVNVKVRDAARDIVAAEIRGIGVEEQPGA